MAYEFWADSSRNQALVPESTDQYELSGSHARSYEPIKRSRGSSNRQTDGTDVAKIVFDMRASGDAPWKQSSAGTSNALYADTTAKLFQHMVVRCLQNIV
jgi:hypothetical protein